MTRLNLTDKNLDSFINSTPYKKIVKASDVAEAVSWICSKQAEGVSAQFITLDYGYSNLREV
jgi:enoyl-[acyl-carrier-protein] reductase (NADH)